MRLFIGIKTRCDDHLIRLQDNLRQMGNGRFAHPENLHITLRFLGEVPSASVKHIKDAMLEVESLPLRLECCGVSLFGKSGIVAANVGGDTAALAVLHERLETALMNRGFARDERRYRPHITLARKFRADGDADIAAIPFETCAFEVRAIVLFESKRVEGRLVYEKVCGKVLG